MNDVNERINAALRSLAGVVHPEKVQPIAIPHHLQDHIEEMLQKAVRSYADPNAGAVNKQVGMAAAAHAHGDMVEFARRVARQLAMTGVITIDDVTVAMSRTYPVAPDSRARQNWKGSVFTGSEWVSVGMTKSIFSSAHGRQVKMWALKSWLAENPLNGSAHVKTAYDLYRIYNDFKRVHTNVQLDKCHWMIGESGLSSDVKREIFNAGDTLYGIHVTLLPGSMGAMLLTPAHTEGLHNG